MIAVISSVITEVNGNFHGTVATMEDPSRVLQCSFGDCIRRPTALEQFRYFVKSFIEQCRATINPDRPRLLLASLGVATFHFAPPAPQP